MRVEGEKMELTSIPPQEWATVVADAEKFWDEIATQGDRPKRVVDAFKKYASVMQKAGYPYR